jgi:hypothetical protein
VEQARLATTREQTERVIRDLQKEADDLHGRLRELTGQNQQLTSKLQIKVRWKGCAVGPAALPAACAVPRPFQAPTGLWAESRA